MISYRVEILEKLPNGILAEVKTKEAFTFGTEPHSGDEFFFSGSYDNSLEIGEKVILKADFIPPNKRIDITKVEMEIIEIIPDRFEPFETDFGLTVLLCALAISTIIAFYLTKNLRRFGRKA